MIYQLEIGTMPVTSGGVKYEDMKLRVSGKTANTTRTLTSYAHTFIGYGFALGFTALSVYFGSVKSGIFIGGAAAIVLFLMNSFQSRVEVDLIAHEVRQSNFWTRARKQNAELFNADDIAFVQVLDKLVSGGRGMTRFKCFELNIVFRNTERVNLLNHKHGGVIKDSARELAEMLGVKVEIG